MRVLALFLLCTAGFADTLVDRDGQVFSGDAKVTQKLAQVGKKKLAIGDVFLVEKEDGTLLYAPDFPTRMRGYESIARDHLKTAYLKLIRKALGVKDFALANEALELAEDAGLASKEAGKHKRRIEKAGNTGRASARVRAEFNKLNRFYGELLVTRAERALKNDKDGHRLLREALRRSPSSKKGQALLAGIAPKDFPIGSTLVWLDWHVDLIGSGAKIAPDDEVTLDGARSAWRRDLHGVQTEPILMITPVKDSQVIGRALSFGTLACNALAELFKTDNPVFEPTAPMTVFLFESREEYMSTTGTGRKQEDSAMLEWSAGHYSPREGISRFFWFKDPDAERRIAGTCVHELTHHWLDERNPRVAQRRYHVGLPAFWIVEGFATFMEEGIFDVDAGKWTLFNPRARSLDILQALPKGRFIPWERYYRLNQIDFSRLGHNNPVAVQGRWWLRPSLLSSSRIFYEQAGATCQFLYHAENGKYRDKLLDYVVAYYTGQKSKLDIKTAFGMSEAELGKKVEAFARQVSGGWRPQKESKK
ncbi:MAG: hypothetical protein ACYTGZ_21680 [Planctomycetota bacterium]|jgi:hypothetical protein